MTKIHIVGLGPGPARYLTLETRDLLLGNHPVYLRTHMHPTVNELKAWGCCYTSFDSLYEQASNFESLYQDIQETLFKEAQAHGTIVYAVPGNPLVAESTVTQILTSAAERQIEVQLHTAVSCLDVMFEALQIDPTNGVHIADSLSLTEAQLHLDQPLLITQVYSQYIASELKLLLLERLDPEFSITIMRAVGCEDQQIETCPLAELDHIQWIDHLTSVYVPAAPSSSQHPLQHLRAVVKQLRDPEHGCPWDLKQDYNSLRKYVLEEAYEVISAIENDDMDALCEELGDLLLQVYLQAQVAEDEELFDLNDVARGIANKLVYRHPHVFGNTEVNDAEEVKERWEELKQAEKVAKGEQSILSDLPQALPALSMAAKISHKVAHVGFDWPAVEGVWQKISEELTELQEACQQNSPEGIFHELGDVLFTLVNLARWHKLDPEDALRQTNHRFTQRFQIMEAQLNGQSLKSISTEAFDQLWQFAKQQVN